MATYTQQGGKRQKVREGRADSVDYYQGLEKVEYNHKASPTDSTVYRQYNSVQRVHSRTMEEWLKYSISLTEFKQYGLTHSHSELSNCTWDDHPNTLDNCKRHIKALFELCAKMGINYWTANDSDLVPHCESREEYKSHWDDIVEYIQELSPKYHVKCLWIAPDLHSHSKYASGAMTCSEVNIFIQAATQIKKCLEISQALNSECFMLWPCTEGYEAIFQTDVAREIKLFAKLLKLTAEYKDKLNYKCQLLITPYYNYCREGNQSFEKWQHWQVRDTIKHYMWDLTSCLYMLKNYNLERYYKVCTPPGHHMYMANAYNMLGGVTLTNNIDHCDTKLLTLMMKSIIDQNSAPPGGINLKLYPRRNSDLRERLVSYVKYVDAAAKALRLAAYIITEQVFSKYIQQRYSSYFSGVGARIAGGDLSLDECEDYYKKNQSQVTVAPSPSKPEHFDVIFQRYIDTCDHI